MKLCIISHKECWQDENRRWYSSGGFPLQIAAISSLFAKNTLVIIGIDYKQGGIPLPSKSKIIPLKKIKSKFLLKKLLFSSISPEYIRKIIMEIKKADVIYLPTPSDLYFLGMLISIMLNKKIIVRYCGSWYKDSKSSLYTETIKIMMKIFVNKKRIMLATGLGNQPPSKNIQWIFVTPLSESEIKTLKPPTSNILNDNLKIVYIGRLSSEKGVENLIKALYIVKKKSKEIPYLTIIGDGPQYNNLKNLARNLGCNQNIFFKGQLNRDQLLEELRDKDLCIQPSLTEGFSKAWLDAMANGIPLIASRVGAAELVIGKNGERGWLVPPGDPEAIAKKIYQIIRNPVSLLYIRKNCFEYVKKFTLEKWTNRIGEICAKQWNMSLIKGKLINKEM